MRSQKFNTILQAVFVYGVLIFFAFFMVFPFVFMLTTSLKQPKDTFNYPPRLLPRDPLTAEIEEYDTPRPLYTINGEPYALVEENIRIIIFANPADPSQCRTGSGTV